MDRATVSNRVALAAFALALGGCGEANVPESGTGGSAGAGGFAGSTAGGGSAGTPDGGNGGNGASSGSGGASGGAGGGGGGSGGSAGAPPFACTSSGDSMKMVAVPAGDFIMGCNAALDQDCSDDEKPMRTVKLAAFEIDETEVTQDMYAACVIAGACDPPSCAWDCNKKDYAASCIDWGRAKMYCAFAKKRLPTEAEWEKAARGTDGRKYPWGNEEPSCEQANMSGCGEKAKPAGSLPKGASPYGALDMSGNMVEMLADWYDKAYYQTAPNVDPKGPLKGTTYVGRGGGYKSTAVWMRASSRDWYDTYDLGDRLGFRCAK